MKNVYLAGAVRTPIGRFGGTLTSWTAADLGVAVAKESLRRAGVTPDQLKESIWGCARQAGGGPNVARQIIYRAGAPETVPAFTVNQACGSGLKAVILAAQEIMLAMQTTFWPAARRACRACLILRKAHVGECAWETRPSSTACIATGSMIRCQVW